MRQRFAVNFGFVSYSSMSTPPNDQYLEVFMELVRGWYSKDVPEKTGQVRLCKATVYRDIVTDVPGIRDDKEGKTRLRVSMAEQKGTTSAV